MKARILSGLKRYQGIFANAQQRDISESDTVVILTDFLSDVLGYDNYQHITTEYTIRGTYVDLAVRVDDDIRFLIEAKAVNSELKDAHVKQAIDYGANHGIEWVILTNGAVWRVYKIHFEKPSTRAWYAKLIFSGKIENRRRSSNPSAICVAKAFQKARWPNCSSKSRSRASLPSHHLWQASQC